MVATYHPSGNETSQRADDLGTLWAYVCGVTDSVELAIDRMSTTEDLLAFERYVIGRYRAAQDAQRGAA